MQRLDIIGISPEEARIRIIRAEWALISSQFRAGYQVFHPIPERHLEIELVQLFKGERLVLHGWNNPVHQVFDWFWKNVIKPHLDWLWYNAIKPSFDWLQSWIKWVVDVLKPILDSVWSGIQGVAGSVISGLSGYFNWIWSGIQGVAGSVISGLNPLLNQIWNATQEILTHIQSSIVTTTASLSGSLSNIAGWITSGLAELANLILAGLESIWNRLVLPIGSGLQKALSVFTEALKNIIIQSFNTLSAVFVGAPEEDPKTIINRAFNLLAITGTSVGILVVQTILGNLVHPLHEMELGTLSAILYEAAGYDHLIDTIIGGFITCNVGIPLGYTLNSIFRPNRPDLNLLKEALGRGKIDDSTAKQWLSWCGYPDRYYPIIAELADSPISPFMLRYMCESEVLSIDTMYEFMLDSGYGERKARMLAHGIYHTTLRPYRLSCTDVARRLYKEGFRTRDWFINSLGVIWRIGSKEELIILRADLEYLLDMEMDILTSMREAYKRRALTDEEWMAIARERRWDSDKMRILLDIEKFKLMPRPRAR